MAFQYDFVPGDKDLLCFACSWALVMSPAAAARHPDLESNGIPIGKKAGFRAWTDDFSNMYRILK
jgi:hypothetical protein